MPAPTVNVSVNLFTDDGQPAVGVTVTAKLDQNEYSNGVIVAKSVSAVTNASGLAVLALFPNAPSPTGLGIMGSVYTFTATVPGGKSLNVTAQVPNSNCTLDAIAQVSPAPALDAAQAATANAQASAAAAGSSATAAATSATNASTSATNASTSATNAATSATNASNSATAASTSAGNASTYAGNASTSATNAATAASNASTSATNASGSATAASTSATNAATSESNALAYRNTANTAATTATTKAGDAASSATAASTSASQAATSASNASTSATAAAGSASTASTQATAAQTSATNASTSASNAATSASNAGTSATNASNSASAAAGSASQAATSATSAGVAASNAQTAAINSATAAGASQSAASVATTAQAAINAVYSPTSLNAAQQIMLGYATSAQNAVSVAQSAAASASSVAQQDLSGVTAGALHRSPNAVTALFIYDTSKDSDGGAWVDRVQDKSWASEPLSGAWLGAYQNSSGFQNELDARTVGATRGVELSQDPGVDNPGLWTGVVPGISATSGQIVFNNVAAFHNGYAVPMAAGPTSLAQGTLYEVTYTITSYTSGTVRLQCVGSSSFNMGSRSAPGTYRETFMPTSGSALCFQAVAAGTTLSIDNISIRQITGVNTNSGDYFQLATDGKFYRLWKNIFPNPDCLNANGTTMPSQWQLDQPFGGNISPSSGSSITFSNGRGGYQFRINGTPSANNRLLLVPNGGGSLVIPGQTYCMTWTCKQVAGTVGTIQVNVLWYDASNSIMSVSVGVARSVTGAEQTFTDNGFVAPAGAVKCRIRYDFNTAVSVGVATDWTVQLGANHFQLGAAVDSYESKVGYTNDFSTSEVFRGNSAKFPKRSAIVAEAGNVTIYDLTQPGRPMWLRFQSNAASAPYSALWRNGGRNATSVAMLNGILLVGLNSNLGTDGAGGLLRLDFVRDRLARYASFATAAPTAAGTLSGGIADRNSITLTGAISDLPYIASMAINALAMTVLGNAPVDPATQLAVPTIGVALGVGAAGQLGTVLMNDGTVVNYGQSSNDGTSVAFTKRGEVAWGISTSSAPVILPLQTASVANTLSASVARFYGSTQAVSTGGATAKRVTAAGNVVTAFGTTTGDLNKLALLRENPGVAAPNTAGLAAHITGNYSTGWMVGDIRRTLLADVAAAVTSSANLITNGTFDTNTNGWDQAIGLISSVGGRLRTTISGGFGRARQAIACVPGRTYRLDVDSYNGTAGGSQVSIAISPGTSVGAVGALGSVADGPTAGIVFTATQTTHYVFLQAAGSTEGSYSEFDNVVLRELIADRSPKAKHSNINGSLAMSPVATAAQLVAYSGFTNDATWLSTNLAPNGSWQLAQPTAGTVTNTAGTVRIQTTDGSYAAVAQGSTVLGLTYAYSITISANSGAGVAVFVGTNQTSGITGTGTFTGTLTTGGASGQQFGIKRAVTGLATDTTITAFSLLPVAAVGSGANVIQEAYSADLDYGTSQWMAEGWFNVPVGTFGPSNFILNSEQIDAAGWTRSQVTVTADADGAADKVVRTANQAGYVASALSGFTMAPGTYHVKARAKAGAVGGRIGMRIQGTYPNRVDALFDLTNGTLIGANIGGTGTGPSASIASVGNGYYDITLSGTLVDNLAQIVISPTDTTATIGGFEGVIPVAAEAYLTRIQFGKGTTPGAYTATTTTAYNGIAPIIDRSGPSGAYWRMGVDGNGYLASEVFDGTTTRNRISSYPVNDGVWHKAVATFGAAAVGQLSVYLDAVLQNASASGAMLTLNNSNALLTIGNSYALNAAFPGSLALVRTGATTPFAEQIVWAYSQERAMFQSGVQVTLADYTALVGSDYDDLQDEVTAATGANVSLFTGLVRTAVISAAGGTFTKCSARSGWHLNARNTANPGVDVYAPSLNLREQLLRRSETAKYEAGLQAGRVFDFDAATSQTDFNLPVGWEVSEVISGGSSKREGSTKDWVRVFNGFYEAARLASAPGSGVWVQLIGRKAA